ncbi:MAG TPA: ABC transporter permease [Solirubrobacteraceae bacterium]|nr:ABC transporter permease [Solirubrobacteraceae bacterium]
MIAVAVAGPVIPTFGGTSSSYACERANRLFCTDWVSQNWSGVLWPALRQHVFLSLVAVVIGFAISFALALVAYRRRAVERPVVLISGILYTIPSLALFEILVPIKPLGLSSRTAEVALVSYTLLILFRNIVTGLREVPDEVREAARGMGMTRRQILWRVEVPLALPSIIAGLRIATVTVIALATVASYICDQGLGVPIFQAIQDGVFKTELIAAGGLAVALALFADGLLVLVQRALTPWSRMRTS